MAIQPKCDKCGNELTEFGAILLGPPNQDNDVKKFHLCTSCYAEIHEGLAARPGIRGKMSTEAHATHLVDLVSEEGVAIDTKKRQDIKKETDLYHTVFTILVTPDKKVVASKVPSRKDLPNLYEGLLAPTVATIRRHKESPAEASMRSLQKELFIENARVRKLGEYFEVLPDGHQKYMTIYRANYPEPREFSHVDIEDLQSFTELELKHAVEDSPEIFTPPFLSVWRKYHKSLLQGSV